jgi:hypothetical protein
MLNKINKKKMHQNLVSVTLKKVKPDKNKEQVTLNITRNFEIFYFPLKLEISEGSANSNSH